MIYIMQRNQQKAEVEIINAGTWAKSKIEVQGESLKQFLIDFANESTEITEDDFLVMKKKHESGIKKQER